MRLDTLYAQLKQPEKAALAAAVGITPGYLWQIATRWQNPKRKTGKKPSIQLMARLASADARLHITDMVAEFAEVDSAESPASA